MTTLVSEKFRIISDSELNERLGSGDNSETALRALLGLPYTEPNTDPDPAQATSLYGESLTDEQIEVWDRFLPNSYSHRAGDWEGYDYVMPPREAMSEIRAAIELGLFHDIQIWTPEDDPDPMAVGVIEIGNADDELLYWPITRWGEGLRPYDEIAAEVHAELVAEAEVRAKYARELQSLDLLGKFRVLFPSVSLRVVISLAFASGLSAWLFIVRMYYQLFTGRSLGLVGSLVWLAITTVVAGAWLGAECRKYWRVILKTHPILDA